VQVAVVSKSTQEFDGRRYYLCGFYFQRKGKRLHRVVWEFHNGPVPAGHHVHHRDHDRANNQPENLEALPGREHIKKHPLKPNPEYIKRAQRAAVAWHKSAEGRAWHREHGKTAWAARKSAEVKCAYCGAIFDDISLHARFCSNKCKAGFRRDSRVDEVDRSCATCGRPFRVSKYVSQPNCSRECGHRSRSEALRRRARL
jgi:endogenous inhibitor of DNA gyrase (YacG/DUF329 family)